MPEPMTAFYSISIRTKQGGNRFYFTIYTEMNIYLFMTFLVYVYYNIGILSRTEQEQNNKHKI